MRSIGRVQMAAQPAAESVRRRKSNLSLDGVIAPLAAVVISIAIIVHGTLPAQLAAGQHPGAVLRNPRINRAWVRGRCEIIRKQHSGWHGGNLDRRGTGGINSITRSVSETIRAGKSCVRIVSEGAIRIEVQR